MKAEYVDHMGSDLSVVNAARVSFSKHHDEFQEDKDTKLISYLARNGHWTPFGHTSITLRVKAPVFVRTQCFKHKIGFVENEVSRRYVDDEPEFFLPVWRSRAENAKQGSSEELDENEQYFWNDIYENVYGAANALYLDLIDGGVAPEQARMVLPQSMYTEWYWTGSLNAYARFYKQRIDPHAQKEIQDLAKIIGEIIEPLFPVSWKALTS